MVSTGTRNVQNVYCGFNQYLKINSGLKGIN